MDNPYRKMLDNAFEITQMLGDLIKAELAKPTPYMGAVRSMIDDYVKIIEAVKI